MPSVWTLVTRVIPPARPPANRREAESAHFEMCGVVVIDGREVPGCWLEGDEPQPETNEP